MKFLVLATALLLGATATHAQTIFPGLKAILTDTEWRRAGLDRLTPDEIGVIDAALIRQQAGPTAHPQTEPATARETVVTPTPTAHETVVPAAAATTVERKPGFFQRFGLPTFDVAEWRSAQPLKAKVVKWESANRFKLDNGQVWEGLDPITYELVGKDIEIQARPHGQFALVIEGNNTLLRVTRLR
jgi:hypothetical protein